jgi:D-serine deaminase-like pyridoxal phosphate-dependent protein
MPGQPSPAVSSRQPGGLAARLDPVAPVLPTGLATPCLVIDLDIVESNARRMAVAVAERGVALRPHVKTHKSVRLAHIQREAGARGVTVGTLGEAEVMAGGGIDDIFIAYPLWADATKADRLRALLDSQPDLRLSVGVDSIDGAERLARAVSAPDRQLSVLLEVDPGNRRTGLNPQQIADVARAAQRAGLDVIGLFTHGGHAYRGGDAITAAAADEVAALVAGADALRSIGVTPRVLSAGSSPTVLGAATAPVNEVRPGTYLLADRQLVALRASPPDGVAMAVAATVISTTVEGQVVLDAGAKSLTKDLPAYLQGYGMLPAYPDGVIERVFDYHGAVSFPSGAARPSLGEVVAVVPNHACPVVDLYDYFYATRSGSAIGRWRVDARGRSG